MASNLNAKIKWETRLCEVSGEIGYFHTWEQYSQPVGESLIVGGPPAGVIAQVFGIVEFEDGVERVEPYRIRFCDEIAAELVEWNERFKEKNEDGTGEKV